jgi:hypothetical protein
MTTQYTTILKLALPVQGELSGSWGDVVNDNITEMVEEAVAGLATINSWTANSHTLTTANGTTSESRCAVLVADDDGAGNPSAAATIICPSTTKLYVLKNISGQQVTLKTAAGTGVAVPNGSAAFLFCDGTNVEACQTDIIDATTIDTTNLEVTNIKAKDGTASGSIANSTGVFTINSAVLTTADINGGTIDGTVIGGSSAAAGTFTDIVASGNISGPANLTIQNSGGGGSYIELVANGQKQFDAYTIGGTTANWVRATGSQTANPVLLSAEGSDTNVAIEIKSKGAERVGFYTNGTEKVRIDSSGNLGIGTSSPTIDSSLAGLSVNASGTVTQVNNVNGATLKLTDPATGGNRGLGITLQGTEAAISNCESGSLRFGTGNTERMRIDSSGNVGIGTASPDRLFEVDEASGDAYMRLRASDTGGGADTIFENLVADNGQNNYIYFGDLDDVNIGLIRYSHASDFMSFTTNASERMRINSSGNLEPLRVDCLFLMPTLTMKPLVPPSFSELMAAVKKCVSTAAAM